MLPNIHLYVNTAKALRPFQSKELLSASKKKKKAKGFYQGPRVTRRDVIFLDTTVIHNSHHGLWKIRAAAAAAKSLQSCPTLCDPMDCSLPGFRASAYFLAKERKHNLWSKSDKNNCLRAIILSSCFDLSFV